MTTETEATNPNDAAPADDQEGVAAAATNEGDSDLDNTDGQDAEVGDADDTDAPNPDDELEELEIEGRKVSIPKVVKPLLMMQADYTKKTQTVAEAARQVEARSAAVEERAQALETTIETRAELVAVKAQIEAFSKLTDQEWDTLEDEDPAEFRRLQRQQSRLKERAGELTTTLQTKETEALQADRTAFETRVKDSQAVLARDIKGWGKPLADQVTEYATANGWSNQDLVRANTNPVIVKTLHAAMLGAAALKREAAAKRLQSAQQTKPGTTVGGASPSARKTTDASGDGLSTTEWMAREDARLAAKRKAG